MILKQLDLKDLNRSNCFCVFSPVKNLKIMKIKLVCHLLFAIALLFSILNSCKNGINIKNTKGQLLLNNKDRLLDPNVVFDTLSYQLIRLETKDQSIFGKIDKVIIKDKFIFIFDETYAKAVLVFDINGKFLNQIGKMGNGPGEYAKLSDIDISYENNQIVLYDLNNRKLIFFDFNGKFINEILLKSNYGMTFSIINSKLFAFFLHRHIKGNNDELIIVNEHGEKVNSQFQIKNKEELLIFANSHYFARSNDKIYIIPSYYDEIYKIHNDGSLNLILDFQNEENMLSDADINGKKNVFDIFKMKKFTSFQSFFINDKEIFFSRTNYENQIIWILGDIKTRRVITFKGFSNYKNVPVEIIGSYNDCFVAIQHPMQYEKSKFPDAQKDENECILLFKLKDINLIKE